MKKISLFIISLFVLSACTPVTPEELPLAPVTNFEECIAAGNPAMESYPRQCRHEEQTFAEEVAPQATRSTTSKTAFEEKPCTREYKPVCGKVQVQCIKAPCPPLKTTFSNRCMAENTQATDIVEGTCEDEGPDLEGTCQDIGGKWLPGSSECEWVSQEACETAGGTFNECASACRNDPEAEICTLQCVLVCEF